MAGIEVEPLSLNQIRRIVHGVRFLLYRLGLLESENDAYIDVPKLCEFALPKFGAELEVVPEEEMGNKHGETILGRNLIRIREDVYERACAGCGRDRLTIAHELGHFFLHDDQNIGLARNRDSTKIPAYRDSEWQANAFAGELLALRELIKNKEIRRIVEEHGISEQAARVQKYRKG